MKKLFTLGCLSIAPIVYAQHEIGPFLQNNLIELRPKEEITIKRLTESTPLGESCILLHNAHYEDYKLIQPLNIEDVYSRIKENKYGVTSGYSEYPLGIALSGDNNDFKEIVCKSGEKTKAGSIAYANGYVDVFAMKYNTNIKDIEKFLDDLFYLEMGERDEIIIPVSSRSSFIWAEPSEHEDTALYNLYEKAKKECLKQERTRFRIVKYKWKPGINVPRYKINSTIKCF